MRIINGKYGRRRFDVPKNITARPTTDFARENLFNVLDNFLEFEELTALDLFAGTGAISFELASRGCRRVVCVESSAIQYAFIKKVAQQLQASELHPVKSDVFRYIARGTEQFDFIFADPPYDLPELPRIPSLILDSFLLQPGGILVVEHSRKNDFSRLPGFMQLRTYGSVNFSFFRKESDTSPAGAHE